MIRIKTIQELKPYVKYIESKYIDGLHSHIIIDFTSRDVLNKVIVDCKCNLREPSKRLQKILGVEKLIKADKYVQYVLVEIHSDALILNDNFTCSKIVSKGLYIKKGKQLHTDYIEATKFIGGGSIKAYGVFSDVLYIEKLNCENFQCKTLSIKRRFKDKVIMADKIVVYTSGWP